MPAGREWISSQRITRVVDKRVYTAGRVPPDFKFPLRESQQAVFDEIDDNAIINAWVSWGKDFYWLSHSG